MQKKTQLCVNNLILYSFEIEFLIEEKCRKCTTL